MTIELVEDNLFLLEIPRGLCYATEFHQGTELVALALAIPMKSEYTVKWHMASGWPPSVLEDYTPAVKVAARREFLLWTS